MKMLRLNQLFLIKRKFHLTKFYKEQKDYYRILGIGYDVDRAEIKKAYYKLARKYHPDANPENPRAKIRFEEIQEAYSVLRDQHSKTRYDADVKFKASTTNTEFKSNSERRYEEIFTEYSKTGRHPYAEMVMGIDNTYTQSDFIPNELTMKVSFKEAARGGSRRVRVRVRDTCPICSGSGSDADLPNSHIFRCPRCGGTGKEHLKAGPLSTKANCLKCEGRGTLVTQTCKYCHGKGWSIQKKTLTCDIPEGVKHEEVVRLNVGEQRVFIKFEIMKDTVFTRDNFDVMQRVLVPLSTVILGGRVKIHSLTEYQTLKVTIPECSAPNTLLRLRGHGIRDILKEKYGDMLLKIEVVPHKKLSPRQVLAMLSFADDEEYSGSVQGHLVGPAKPTLESGGENIREN